MLPEARREGQCRACHRELGMYPSIIQRKINQRITVGELLHAWHHQRLRLRPISQEHKVKTVQLRMPESPCREGTQKHVCSEIEDAARETIFLQPTYRRLRSWVQQSLKLEVSLDPMVFRVKLHTNK
jgi:hypothetical protein